MRLTIKAAIKIIILVIGIQLLFDLFKDISSFFYYPETYREISIFYYLGIIPGADVLGLIVLGLLWWKTDWIVKLLVGNVDDDALIINTSSIDFVTVVIQLIGLYLVVSSIPDFVGLTVYHVQLRNTFQGFDLSVYQVQETEQWVITSLNFLVGLLLATYSKWFVKKSGATETWNNQNNIIR